MSPEAQNSLRPFSPYDCVVNSSERLILRSDYSPLEALASIVTIIVLMAFIAYPRLILLIPLAVSFELAWLGGGGAVRIQVTKSGIDLRKTLSRFNYTATLQKSDLRSISCAIDGRRRGYVGHILAIDNSGKRTKVLTIGRKTESELLEDLQALSVKIGGILTVPVESSGATV